MSMEGLDEIVAGVKNESEDETATGSSPAVSAQPGSPAPSTGGKSSDSPASIIASGASGIGKTPHGKKVAEGKGNSKKQKKHAPCKICGQLFAEMPSGLPT